MDQRGQKKNSGKWKLQEKGKNIVQEFEDVRGNNYGVLLTLCLTHLKT